jgi:hypothetical protein
LWRAGKWHENIIVDGILRVRLGKPGQASAAACSVSAVVGGSATRKRRTPSKRITFTHVAGIEEGRAELVEILVANYGASATNTSTGSG